MQSIAALRWYIPSRILCIGMLAVAIQLMPQAVFAVSARSQVTLYPVPEEVRSNHFRVGLNGRVSDVLHAATGYYLLNFDTDGPVSVSVTAADPHFWDAGVEVQPMRFGIRPLRHGATITFSIPGPVKLTITRPGDHFADADMLFLFANPTDSSRITPATPNVRYYGAGVHHENIDAHSGDTIYLAGGAVIFGSLNIWQVHDVRVLGRGSILYDGPQNPYDDEGWMHQPNWHVIVMDNAHNIEIDGITCITRSRSWQIQMRDSRNIGFYNIKAIGGNPNDANQDGMDWLGGGDTTVRDSFFRASDDVFALQGNWDGYDPVLLRIPGHDVTNITIEDSVLSTSISNTIRVGWPAKTFNSAHFQMNNVDVLHTGFGACKVPFAFFELWADPDGKGSHSDYRFSDIRLEDWYSLFQLRQPLPRVRDIGFTDIWAMDGPAMVSSVVQGDISGVRLSGVTEQGFEGSPARLLDGAIAPSSAASATHARFAYTPGLLMPGQKIAFTAEAAARDGRRFTWLFGDGTLAEGRRIEHVFRDAEGTLLDGSGRFRVLLHVVDRTGEQAWNSEAVVLTPVAKAGRERPIDEGSQSSQRTLHVPADGGYTITLLTSKEATLSIDGGKAYRTPKARGQVCGAAGNAVQPVRVSVTLTAGDHLLRIDQKPGLENADTALPGSPGQPTLLWEGPGIERQPIPGASLSEAVRINSRP